MTSEVVSESSSFGLNRLPEQACAALTECRCFVDDLAAQATYAAGCAQQENADDSSDRRILPMNAAVNAPSQQVVQSRLVDAALCESLAREFNVPAREVEAIYREEHCRLAADARIKTFVGVLATRRVRARLRR